MLLSRALRIKNNTVAAFVGAGGKTTALFQLARDLEKPTIVTSTTHFGKWQIPLADHHILIESHLSIKELEHNRDGIILVTGPIVENKTSPIDANTLEQLRGYCHTDHIPLLIEADGSKQRPLKAPAEHEPAIPAFTDIVVTVAGLSGLEKPLSEENVHRPEIFATLSGLKNDDCITSASIIRVLAHPKGGLKNIPAQARKIALINQADTPELQSIGGQMAEELLRHFDSVVVSSLERLNIETFEATAGIILAAGESNRFGQPKQLLNWRGKFFVRQVAETALAAGLDPVVVVTGAGADNVEAAVKDLPVQIMRNTDWQKGQSSSIKAGILSLPEKIGAAVFLLADQPQIPVDVIKALTELHAKELQPIIAPLVLEERRANPVLFDHDTFQDLLKLEGDIGGRAIFDKYQVEYLPWHDDRLLLDVDKPEDYKNLIEDETL
jgi:molybdenum cofactor cytidylyltransferase